MPHVTFVTLFAAAASLSSMLGFKSVQAEVVIPASPDRVWQVLMDTKSYSHWNQVLTPVSGELVEGSDVLYRFHQDENTSSEITARVQAIEPERLLNQSGGYYGLLTFNHSYMLEPVDAGTRVTIYEEYTGLGVHFWDPTPVGLAYGKLAESLKLRVIELD